MRIGLGAAKRFPGLDKSVFPKVWNLIASLPKPKHKTLDKDTAIKAIKSAQLSSTNVKVLQNEPTGIAQDAAVIVESAEYAASPPYRNDVQKADHYHTAQSQAHTLKRASSSARRHKGLFSVSNQVCSCISRDKAISCVRPAARNYRRVLYRNVWHEERKQVPE